MQLDQALRLDLLAQRFPRSPLTDRWRICSRLTSRLAQESAAQAHPSQPHSYGLATFISHLQSMPHYKAPEDWRTSQAGADLMRPHLALPI
jgi:hypothetical protein